jgi:hypothetical protein
VRKSDEGVMRRYGPGLASLDDVQPPKSRKRLLSIRIGVLLGHTRDSAQDIKRKALDDGNQVCL